MLRPIAPILKKLARIYTRKEREYSYNNISVKVLPGVFHPGLFISTKMLLNFVDTLNLKSKIFLELGAGTGIISILAAKKGATVYASDISSKAVENVKLNAAKNNVQINIFTSDLFKNIPDMQFDYIIINPPYYSKDPREEEEYAWFCGSNFEYFKSLFNSLSNYIGKDSKVFMILSEVCDIQKIKSIGLENEFAWKIKMKKQFWGEKNYIFEIKKS
ncbi:MAG: methyltransferase [Ignavibacteria bacterium]|nr:methyltransferase [Ignavibacteria bacterium]